jgi:hypothetical protein
MDKAQLQSLVRELISLPEETEWVEFKYNKAVPAEIGEYSVKNHTRHTERKAD